jgi:hypothetical protein
VGDRCTTSQVGWPLLAKGGQDTLPNSSREILNITVSSSFNRCQSSINFMFVCVEEGLEMIDIKVRRALSLRKRDVKEEK